MSAIVALVLLALAADAPHGWALVLLGAAIVVVLAGLVDHLLERR